MYYNGFGVLQDYKQAFKWYSKAAEQGLAKAQNNLALMYYNGFGVPQDDKQAFKWYTKAADQGNAMAQYNLGLMYEDGEGVPQDYKQAVKWFSKAAEQGDADGQNSLAWLLASCPEDGLRNGSLAVTYARKACEQTGWKDADCIDTLAAAYAEAGQFANAIKCQRKAMEDPGFRESSGKEARARLELYKAGRPYREKAAGVP